VDGFVRTAGGDPVPGVTVAAYDGEDTWYEKFGFSCTDDRGYFSLVAANFSDRLPAPAFMQASKEKKILPSNAPQVVPVPGTTDRVEIILGEKTEKGECAPPAGGNTQPKNTPPEKDEPKPKIEPPKEDPKPKVEPPKEDPKPKVEPPKEDPKPKVDPKPKEEPKVEPGVHATGYAEPAPKKRRKQ
jgi:hypothetical protein